MAPRRRRRLVPLLLLLLALATLATLLAVGARGDSGRRRLREKLDAVELIEVDEVAQGDSWAMRLGGANETMPDGGDEQEEEGDGDGDGGDGDGDSSLLPPPSFPLLTDELTDRCRAECETPRENDCVADLSANCNATINYGCPSCDLWRNVNECLNSTGRHDCGGMGPPVYYSPPNALVPSPASNWLVLPLEPVVGVENMARGDAGRSTADAWLYGWADAVAGTTERPQIPARELTILINSLDQRTKHSLHLHVGRKSHAWASCVGNLPLPPQGVWWRASCKGLSLKSSTEPTELKYLWPRGGRANILAAAKEGLALVWPSTTAGVALVAYPHANATTVDENLVIVYEGEEVNDYTLLRQ